MASTPLTDVALAGVQGFALHPQNRTGHALYNMSYCALSLPFTLLINFLAAQLFTSTQKEKEEDSGVKKISTWNALGDTAFKTALTAAKP